MAAKKGVTLLDCLKEIEDPRRPSNGKLHDFQEILVMAIAAVLSDCDTVEEIAWWAREREEMPIGIVRAVFLSWKIGLACFVYR